MAGSIHKEAFYPHPPESVWQAITDPKALAEWLMPNDFKPKVGHKFRFQVDPMPGCGHLTFCEVRVVEPPRRLVYSWMPAKDEKNVPQGAPSVVSWTLHPERGGTRLALDHTGLEVYSWWQRFMLRFGWGTMVKRWIPNCAANVKDGKFIPGVMPLEKRCYKCKTIPDYLVR